MKKMILSLIIMGTMLYADPELDALFKNQCNYTAYGKGENNTSAYMYLLGAIAGITFTVDSDKRSVLGNSDYGNILIETCKAALKFDTYIPSNEKISFDSKFMTAVENMIKKQ